MDGRGWTGKVVDLTDLDVERKTDVVADRFEAGIGKDWREVAARTREIIIDTNYVIPLAEEQLAEV
jgi:hypothetical protein